MPDPDQATSTLNHHAANQRSARSDPARDRLTVLVISPRPLRLLCLRERYVTDAVNGDRSTFGVEGF